MNRYFIFAVVAAIIAAVAYGGFLFLGEWIDGRRQAIRDKGLHPVTTSDGNVEAREYRANKDETDEPSE